MSSDGNRGDQDDDADQTMRNAPIRVQEISLDIFLHCTIRSWYQFLLQCGCGWCCQCEFVGKAAREEQWTTMDRHGRGVRGVANERRTDTNTHEKYVCIVCTLPNARNPSLSQNECSCSFEKRPLEPGDPQLALFSIFRHDPIHGREKTRTTACKEAPVLYGLMVRYHTTIPHHRCRDSFLPDNILTTVSNLTQPNNNHYDNHIHNAA